MKRQIWLAGISLAALLAISGALASEPYLWQSGTSQGTTDTVDSWARENYSHILDLVLRDRCAQAPVQAGRAIDARWIACVRIVPAFKNEIEYSVSLEKRYDGILFAQIVKPESHSVYFQLCERKREQPRASGGDLAKLIATSSESGDQQRFPGLARLADQFEKIRLSPVLSDEIMMDPTEYRFSILSLSGERLQITLLGPGSAAPHQPPGLIQWAESLKETLATSR